MIGSNNYPSIAIYLYGNSISLDELSGLLGLSPTAARNKGDVRFTSTGAKLVQKIGFWEYRISLNTPEIISSLSEIINSFDGVKIIGVAGVEKAELDIFYPIGDGDESIGFSMELPCKVMEALSAVGFDLIFTVR